MKPGRKTSEHWISWAVIVLPPIFSALVLTDVLTPAQADGLAQAIVDVVAVFTGTVIPGIAAREYTKSRTKVKEAESLGRVRG